MNTNNFAQENLFATFTYQHPLPEEMAPRYRHEDAIRRERFRREQARWARKQIPTYCLK